MASSIALERRNLREGLPELAPTVVANMTAPVLRVVAEQLIGGGSREGVLRSLPAVAPGPSPGSPNNGLLGPASKRAGRDRRPFAPLGLVEADRRLEGDWAALLLRAA